MPSTWLPASGVPVVPSDEKLPVRLRLDASVQSDSEEDEGGEKLEKQDEVGEYLECWAHMLELSFPGAGVV